jgi:EAL domain-containing protein (putative c-di-GMP-specific phosphodiesterase class I)
MSGESHAGVIDLAHALRAGWVEFWYQPKIDLKRRHVVGIEMFARARHPFHGMLTAGVLLPGADDRAIAQLTVFALRWAMQAGAALAVEGVRLPLTVNVPANAVMPQALATMLGEDARKPDWPGLILDVPKGDILANHGHFSRITSDLAAMRIRIAADDFCGNLRRLMRLTNPDALFDEMEALSKHLNKLKELSLAELKLDRDLIAGCAEEQSRAMLCELIVDLIHQLGAKAVAVGVERHADAALLREIGCDIAQGNVFSEPMPLEQLIMLFKSRRGPRVAAAPTAPSVAPAAAAESAAVPA